MERMEKSRGCPYCAHAPVNHRVQWVLATADVLLARMAPRWLSGLSASLERHAPALERAAMQVLLQLGVARIGAAADARIGGRLRVIMEAAQSRGIPIERITLFGRADDQARIFLRGAWQYFVSIPVPPELPAAGWMDDKRTFNRRLSEAGLPVAESRTVWSERGALAAAEELGWPVIVKPADGSRARHTSTNISDTESLLAAFQRAKQLCAFVLIERHIPGDTYRATCVGGHLVAAMHYVKPGMEADGVHTCEELRQRYNESLSTVSGVSPVEDTPWFRDALARQGLEPKDVPAVGRYITFAEHSERINGGKNRDVTDQVPGAVREEVERAARLVGSAVIGFDLISRDLTDPQEPFTFIEGNSLPFIDIHHDPTEGQPRDVAGAVLSLWD